MSFNSGTNRQALLTAKQNIPTPAAPEYKEVKEGDSYSITRVKITKVFIVVEVKRNKIKLKRDVDSQDSFTISRAEFDKFYKKV